MKQQPDKLFHKKLRNYSKPVPGSAWGRIEAGIEKKPYPFYKLAIAASLLLLSVCIYIFWPSSLSEQRTVAQTNEAEKTDERIHQEIEPVTRQQPEKSIDEKKNAVQTQPQKPAKRNDQKITAPAKAEVPMLVQTQEIVENQPENSFANEKIIIENITEQKIDSDTTKAKNESENLFIVFTADDTREYLSKTIPQEATPEPQTASTFKKVLRKARDLKSNNAPYADLRQMKNEILALNFKSDKERGQKK